MTSSKVREALDEYQETMRHLARAHYLLVAQEKIAWVNLRKILDEPEQELSHSIKVSKAYREVEYDDE